MKKQIVLYNQISTTVAIDPYSRVISQVSVTLKLLTPSEKGAVERIFSMLITPKKQSSNAVRISTATLREGVKADLASKLNNNFQSFRTLGSAIHNRKFSNTRGLNVREVPMYALNFGYPGQILQTLDTKPDLTAVTKGQRRVLKDSLYTRVCSFTSTKANGTLPVESKIGAGIGVYAKSSGGIAEWLPQGLPVALPSKEFVITDFFARRTDDPLPEISIKPIVEESI